MGEKKNSILDYINICIVIRRAQNLPYNSLINHRDELRKKMGIKSEDIKIKRIKPFLDPVIEEIKHKLAYDTENNIFTFTVETPIKIGYPSVNDFDDFIAKTFPKNDLFNVRIDNVIDTAKQTTKFDVILYIK